jgi:nitrate/nitrite-specific signal transduction histidine kinase
VRISLQQDDDRLHLTVRDDGVGFTIGAQPATGVGLVGMAERAREIRGTLTIESSPGNGTTLRLELPFNATGAPVRRIAHPGVPEVPVADRPADHGTIARSA